MFFRQQCQGPLEKFHHATGGATVPAPQPAAQRTLLPPVALEYRGIQIQTISRRTSRKPFQLPTPQAGEKTLALSLTEALEQIANGVIDRKARDPQHGVQSHVGTQQTGVFFF